MRFAQEDHPQETRSQAFLTSKNSFQANKALVRLANAAL
jgi:hypothetical protein